MYQHILVPTDGSELSRKAIDQSVRLAKSLGAKITALHVVPEFHTFTYQPEMLEDTRAEYAAHSRARGEQYIDVLRQAASAAGVASDGLVVSSDQPHDAIIAAATDKGCDLILMASHGRRGVQGLLLGSETQKVLAYSKIPVLVYR